MADGQPIPEISWSQSRFAGLGLRTRFRPSRRVRMLFLVVVPWIDALLLLGCFLFTIHEKAIAPGIVADIPADPVRTGIHPDLVFVVNPATDATASAGALVFFNEVRYDTSVEANRRRLEEDVRAEISLRNGAPVSGLLSVDRSLSYGELADLVIRLRECGLSQIDLATKPR